MKNMPLAINNMKTQKTGMDTGAAYFLLETCQVIFKKAVKKMRSLVRSGFEIFDAD